MSGKIKLEIGSLKLEFEGNEQFIKNDLIGLLESFSRFATGKNMTDSYHSINGNPSLNETTQVEAKNFKKELSPNKKSSGNTLKKTGAGSYLKGLIEEEFFNKPKGISDVKEELNLRAHNFPHGDVSKALFRLCKKKELRRMKGDNGTFIYTKWY